MYPMNSLTRRSIICSLFLLLLATGCSKKAPAEANAALAGALDALATANSKDFVAAVVPAQQAKVQTLKQWPFFQAIKAHSIDNEFDRDVTDSTATILCMVYFDSDKKVHSTLHFDMKKVAGKWHIDLAETIRMQIATNGAFAFKKYKFVMKP